MTDKKATEYAELKSGDRFVKLANYGQGTRAYICKIISIVSTGQPTPSGRPEYTVDVTIDATLDGPLMSPFNRTFTLPDYDRTVNVVA